MFTTKHNTTPYYFLLLLLSMPLTVSAQLKGVAINRSDLDPGLVLDVSGIDGSNRLGVRFSPLGSAPGTPQEGSMYFDRTLNTYRQFANGAWQRMASYFTQSGTSISYTGTVNTGPLNAGAITGTSLSVDVLNSDVRVTTARVNTDRIVIGEDIPADNSLHLQHWGNAWFRNGSTGTRRFVYIDNLAVLGVDDQWREIRISGSGGVSGPLNDILNPSDSRLKEQILPIGQALSKLNQLNGVNYTWNNLALDLFTEGDGNGLVRGPDQTEAEFTEQLAVAKASARDKYTARETGLIAQDLQKVLPEAVVEAEDGYLRVKYGHLAGLFVEAIKEQQTIIEAQAERIRELESQQLSVMARLEKLEAVAAPKKNGQTED